MAVSSVTTGPAKSTEPPRVAYLNGRWIEHRALSISADDLGFRQAVTAVERLRTYRRAVFQLDPHVDRWQATLDQLHIRDTPPRGAMAEATAELLRRNASFVEASSGDVGITWFATPGLSDGGEPTLGMHLNPIDPRLVEQRRLHGQPLIVSDVVQPPPESWPRTIKVRCRLHYYLADRMARRRAAGASAVLLDTDGSITETSVANIAVVSGGEITSPPAGRVLGGITQRVIESLAEPAGIRWRKAPVSPEMLRRADEVLLMGTDTGLWFASVVDERPIAAGYPGEIYRALLERFDRLIAAVPEQR